MPISRALGATAAVLVLGACDPSALGGASDRTTVMVAGRSIAVAAPAGFCVDRASTNTGTSGAFVLVSDCALLGGPVAEGDGGPVGAVLTASISSADGTDGAQSLAGIEGMSATREGRAILGRSGRGDQVRILATRSRNDVLYLLIEDRGPPPVAGVEPQFWRAFLLVEGHMTVLSVLGFEGAGVGPTEGLALIQGFADRVQAANGA